MRIRVTKDDINDIRDNNSEIIFNLRTSRRFRDICKRWKKKNRKPVKQLIVYAVLKYLIEEGECDAENI
jgi:hypothetical protein